MSDIHQHVPDRRGSEGGTDWRDRAACRDIDPELFFPVGNAGPALLQIGQAKQVCAGCSVRTSCLEWALDSYLLDLKLLSEVIGRQVIRDVDHRNLNTDVPWLKGRIPTVENLALVCWERLRPEFPHGQLRSVPVWETDKNWAEIDGQV